MDTQRDKTNLSDQNLSGNRAATPPEKDVYEVRLNSYKIAGALGITAVHNEIAFYKNGKVVIAFNGNAHNVQNGNFTSFAITPGYVLRVTATDFDFARDMQLSGSVTLAKLTRNDCQTQINKAIQVGRFINSNAVDYIVLGDSQEEAQNSNSVATSILSALGYEYPSGELKDLWAPGKGRHLIPDNWNPKIETGFSDFNRLLLIPNDVVIQTREAELPMHLSTGRSSEYPTIVQHYFNPNAPSVVYPRDENDHDERTAHHDLVRFRRILAEQKSYLGSEKFQNFLNQKILDAIKGGKLAFPENVFLSQEPSSNITQNQREAAKNLQSEMLYAVANHLRISVDRAVELQKRDQSAFVEALDICLKEEKIPAPHFRDPEMIKSLVAKELKIAPEDFDQMPAEKLGDVLIVYKKLEKAGFFQEESPPNPYLLQYTSQYIAAVRESKPQEVERASTQEQPSTTHQDVTEALKAEARRDVYGVMSSYVARRLKISPDRAADLPDVQYFKIVKQGLAKGEIPFSTGYSLTEYERSVLVSKELGVDIDLLNNYPFFIRQIAYDKLEKEGLFYVSRSNPYVKGEIEREIGQYTSSSPAPVQQNRNLTNNTVRVDLNAEGGGIMEIGGMSVPSYFSLQADPATARTDNSPQPTRPAPLVKGPNLGLNT